MHRLLLIAALLFPFLCTAQDDYKNLHPVAFPAMSATDINSFNNLLMDKIPEYHLTWMDSSSDSKWEFGYTSNEREELELKYTFEEYGAVPDLKIPAKRRLEGVYVKAQFLSLVKIYNTLFGKSVKPEDLHAHGAVNEVIHPGGDEYYSFKFGKGDYGKQEWTIAISRTEKPADPKPAPKAAPKAPVKGAKK